ncbi:MAG: hypothetical protein ACFE0Q_20480 [Anaerolineae bacterium]
MVDYLTEVFPVDASRIEQLTAYQPTMARGIAHILAQDLLTRITRTFTGRWVWTGELILTDEAPAPIQIDIMLDVLRKEFPMIFGDLQGLQELTDWYPTVEDAGVFTAQWCEKMYDDRLRQLLRQHGTRIPNGYVMRDYHLAGWEVDGQPALSLRLQSRLLALYNVQMALTQGDDVIGLQVIDKTNARNIGIITEIRDDDLASARERLLGGTLSSAMHDLLMTADPTDQVVTVSFGAVRREYVASALNIIIRPEEHERFSIDRTRLASAQNLPPATMASIVSSASDLLKVDQHIGNAYNNRTTPHHFIYLDHVPEMTFGNQRVRPYKLQTLANEFIVHGLFAKHLRFKDAPIRIAVINALDSKLATDFVEAMRRQMERDFEFDISMIRERTIRVVSPSNLASAVRVVEKEQPHILLACFADDQEASYEYLKTLTLGKGIALQAIYESTMHNPDAMGWVIMGVLARTGSTPFVLTEPFDSVNLVVGLDWVREKLTRGDRVVGMTRIYRRDGYFMRYFMDIQELEPDVSPPMSMIQMLFPEPIFKGKRVMIHYHGTLPHLLLKALSAWGESLDAEFSFVEIHTECVPHIYALQEGIAQPPWGSVYLLNPVEAFVVSSSSQPDTMPEAIHLRIRQGDVTIEQTIYAVLALTLLNYGTSIIPRLPVTIQNAEQLAGWLARGMLPNNVNGDVAFWL